MTDRRLLLVRHGRTELNAAGRLRGEIDVPLDSVGEAEAAALGEAFRGVPLDVVVSSPLSRAVGTAHVLVSSSRPVTLDARLRDRSYGSWAGHSPSELEERFGSVDDAPGVERRDAVEMRALAALADAVGPGRGAGTVQRVVLVTHDAVLRILLRSLLPALEVDAVALPTGSWSELKRAAADTSWTVVRLGSTGPAPQGRARGGAAPG